MHIQEFNAHLIEIRDEILEAAPDIIAATATEYYRDSFRRKDFDGKPWQSPKTAKLRGSLLVDSGALANSIRPAVISPQKVVISAGNDHVLYAEIHNEGFHGLANIPEHQRKTQSSGITTVKAHQRAMDMPQRQFLGQSEEMEQNIIKRLEEYINSITNNL